MNFELFREIIGYTQNLGSREDLVTGCLATAFHYCPVFTESFFQKIGINDFPWKNRNKYDYLISTGPRINGNYGKIGAGVDFKPDIMISRLEEWSDESQLKKEHLILIESKMGAAFGENQKQNYQLFKEKFAAKFPDQIKLILISLKNESSDGFYPAISWFEVIKISEEIIRLMDDWNSEKLILTEIFSFMKISLVPSVDSLKNICGEYCPESIMKELKSRTDFSSARLRKIVSISENPISCPNYEQMFKMNEIGLKSPMSYIDISDDIKERYLGCAVCNEKALFWAEHIDEKEHCKIVGILRLNSPSWIEDWFDILSKMCSL
jgi:hypothetical protein